MFGGHSGILLLASAPGGLVPLIAGRPTVALVADGTLSGLRYAVNYRTLLPRRIRASVLEERALICTPGDQSPARGW